MSPGDERVGSRSLGVLASLWGPVLLYMAGISYLSHQPRLDLPGGFPDWLLHGGEYAGLAVLLTRAFAARERHVTSRAGILVVATAVGFGCLDELHQSFVPGREPSLADVVADGTGALFVAWIARAVRRGPGEASRGRRGSIEITLFGRPDCHLCEEAAQVIERAGREFPITLTKVDIDGDPRLARVYSEQVPVVTINGRKWSKLRLDSGRLHRKLASMSRGHLHG